MTQKDDFLGMLARTDPWINAITPQRIERAIEGFPHLFAVGWDSARLADRIQDAATFSRERIPQGNSEAKAELLKLARKSKELRRGMERMGGTASIAALFEVLRCEEERRGTNQIDWAKDYMPLMLQPLQYIEETLARAASQIGTQRKQVSGWQKKIAQEYRVGFAIHLGPVFEEAYGGLAKSHNWAADFGKEHPWREFYRRIYCELFPDAGRLNLAEVLQEAAGLRPKIEAMTRQFEQDATRIENLRE